MQNLILSARGEMVRRRLLTSGSLVEVPLMRGPLSSLRLWQRKEVSTTGKMGSVSVFYAS